MARPPTPEAELAAFLRTRRERIAPHAVGLPATGRRRTPGLRREEVAALAAISVAWYACLEQGQLVHPSAEALNAIARVLQLEQTEHAYVFQLARLAPNAIVRPTAGADAPLLAAALTPTPACPDGTPPDLRQLLSGFGATAALLIDGVWDVVGRNQALTRLLPDLPPERTTPAEPPRNVLRTLLCDPAARSRWGSDWERVAHAAVRGFRASLADDWAVCAAGARADTLTREFLAGSPEFRRWWASHDVWRARRPLRVTLDHPAAGATPVTFLLLDVRSAPGVVLVACVPDGAPVDLHV